MKKVKRMYGIPQEILYTVCLAAWKLCSENLQKFSALKAFYTEAFIATAVQAVRDARQLPESRETIAARTVARIKLQDATRQVQTNWQLLKAYIIIAFEPNMVKTKLTAAGSDLYPRASLDNWSAVRSLIETANLFIAGNLAELMANENMPADFQTTFKANGDTCIELSEIFSKININKEMATGIKIDANCAIYSSAIKMLKDGQQIFKDDANFKKQFTYRYLVSRYRGEGSASLKGYIVNNLKLPVEGAVIVSQDQKYIATTNSKGHYHIRRIAAGTYTFTVTCPGYEPVEQSITFVAATASKGDFELTNVMLKVA